VDKTATLIWVHGTEFLIKTRTIIRHPQFKETGAKALATYGIKLIPAENIYFHTKRVLALWDHAYLTILARKNDPTQLRYLACLYKKHTPDPKFKQKGYYYDPQAMTLVLDLFEHNKETSYLRMKDVEELERLYGG
jgi:hypothetical protein